MSNIVYTAISNFTTATSARDYRRAKAFAARLPVVQQFAIVDSIVAARRRLEACGVLVR